MIAANRCAFFGRLMVAAVLIAGFTVASSSAVRAQDTEPATYGKYSLKAGFFLPTQGTLRQQSSMPYYSLGVDYNPNLRFKLQGASITLGAEFKWRQSGGKTYLLLPITARALWDLTPKESKLAVYGGIGGGVYFVNTGFIGGTTQLGAKFIVGANISDKYYVEMNYDYVGGFSDSLGNGLRVDGLTFYLGRRF